MTETSQGLSLDRNRKAQQAWAALPVARRLRFISNLRDQIAIRAEYLLDCFPPELSRKPADSLTAEIIPLADACRFLQANAQEILAPKKPSEKGRPVWCRKVDIEVRREPFGIVLLIGPSNYPLFLVGVQAIQALVAGNGVLIKPGRGGLRAAQAFAELVARAGFPSDLIAVLDEDVKSVNNALEAGVDKIVLTGSLQTGRAVLREAAERVIPVTAELSGFDPVFVQAGADLQRATRAVRFGTELNGGETCIAPKRIYVHESVVERFLTYLGPSPISITIVRNDDEALELAARSPYALGATIFGEDNAARRLAARVNAGVVVVNDMVVPTADPRVPFGGRAWSGFGTTRGAAGLLEMTTSKAVIVQRSGRLRHLEPLPVNAGELFLAFLQATHNSSAIGRLTGWFRFIKAATTTRKVKQ